MIQFNLDKVFDMAAEYIYSDEKKPLTDDVEYLFEMLSGMRDEYTYDEVARVVNSINFSIDPDTGCIVDDDLKGIKKLDVAWITSHFGFLFGMLYALNHKE